MKLRFHIQCCAILSIIPSNSSYCDIRQKNVRRTDHKLWSIMLVVDFQGWNDVPLASFPRMLVQLEQVQPPLTTEIQYFFLYTIFQTERVAKYLSIIRNLSHILG